MDMQWNVEPVNGLSSMPFISKKNYLLYSKPILELFEKKNNVRSDSESTTVEVRSKSEPTIVESVAEVQMGTKHSSLLKPDAEATICDLKTEANKMTPNIPNNVEPEKTIFEEKQDKRSQADLHLKVKYPKPSCLTKEEQRSYMELFDYFRHNPANNTEENKLLIRLKELQEKVFAEQEEYMLFLQNASQTHPDDYMFLHRDAKRYVEGFLECGRQRVSRYPRYYTLHDAIPIVPAKKSTNIQFNHIQTLLEMGIVPKAIVPNIKKMDVKLPREYAKVSQRYSFQLEDKDEKQAVEGNIFEKLAEKYRADITISSASLECLLDNHAPYFHRQWEMAVIIKEVGPTKQKVVCIDKPFIPKNMTQPERNLLFHKLALKTSILHPLHSNFYQLEKKYENPDPDANIFEDVSADINNLELFGLGKATAEVVKAVDGDPEELEQESTEMEIPSRMTCDVLSVDESGDCKKSELEVCSESEIPSDVSQYVDFDNPIPSPIVSFDGLADDKPSKDLNNSKSCSGRRRSLDSVRSPPPQRRSLRIARARCNSTVSTDSEAEGNLVIDVSPVKKIKKEKEPEIASQRKRKIISNENEESDDDKSTEKLIKVEKSETIVESTSTEERMSVSELPGLLYMSPRDLDEQKNAVKKLKNEADVMTCSNGTTPENSRNCDSDGLQTAAIVPIVSKTELVAKNKSDKQVKPEPCINDPEVGNSSVCDTGSLSTVKTDSSVDQGRRTSSEAPSSVVFQAALELTDPLNKPWQKRVAHVKVAQTEDANAAKNVKSLQKTSSMSDPHSGASSFRSPLDQILMDQSRMFSASNPRPSFSGLPTVTSSGDASQISPPTMKPQTTVQCSARNFDPDESLNLNQSHKDFNETTSQRNGDMSENVADYEKPQNGNVSYNLWELGDLKLITKHRYHGFWQNKKQSHLVQLLPKLEYQSKHGCEQLTPTETVRSWLMLKLRPNARLIRARVDALTSTVLKFENFNFDDLQNSFNPSQNLTMLHSLLERLKKLDVGSYLIGHAPGNSHIQIKKTTNSERGVYDLHLAYRQPEAAKTAQATASIHWLPIEPTIRLKFHTKFWRIPCTFEPIDTALVNTVPQKRNFGKSSKKVNKKEQPTRQLPMRTAAKCLKARD